MSTLPGSESLFEGSRTTLKEAIEFTKASHVDLINAEEFDRITELIEANTWLEGWDGSEPEGDALLDKIFNDGSVQPLLGELLS